LESSSSSPSPLRLLRALRLAGAKDVLRFASLGTTEQGDSGTQFRVDYLKPSGAIGFYHPDWVAVQRSARGEINWIIETKGREWEGTTAKDEAMANWCTRVSAASKSVWSYLRVNQHTFEAQKPGALADLLETVVATTELAYR
jgi:type III restriction enzyme